MVGSDEFAVALRTAIGHSGMSLSEIAQRLRGRGRGVSVASLSHWQSGRSLPESPNSLGALAALEELLGQSPDDLMGLLRAPRPRGRAMQHAEITDFIPESVPIRDALEELGFGAPETRPHERFVHERLVVDSSRSWQVATFLTMVRALEDGPCRLPSVTQLAPDEPNLAPEVTALSGCTLGRRLAWPDRRTYATEIVVDGAMEAGQQAVLGFQVAYRAASPFMTEATYAVPRRAHDLMIEVEFRGPEMPIHCERYQRTAAGEVSAGVRRDLVDRIQVAESGFGPGMLGLRWEWPAQA